MIEQQIHAQYPHAEIEEIIDYNLFHEKSAIVGAYIDDTERHYFPIRTYKKMDSDPLSAILNVLSRVRDDNASAAVQYVIRSAHKKWRRPAVRLVREVKKGKKFEHIAAQGPIARALYIFRNELAAVTRKKDDAPEKKYELSPLEEEMVKGIEEKLSKGGLDVTIRLLSVSDHEELAKQHLDNLVNAFSQYNSYRYGNRFSAVIPRKQSLLIRDFIHRSIHEKRKVLMNTEEMTSLWHLPLHSTEAPNVKWLGSRRAPPPTNIPQAGLLLGHVMYRGVDMPIRMKEADRRRHLYVIGKSGTGKSVFMTNLAIQDIENGHGVCVVDPHGDLVEDVLQHIPKHRADDVIIFNPSDVERPIGLNMLEAKTPDQKILPCRK